LKIHTVTGLPRAGSTLLCNIFNQNPKFWASSTSVLPRLCSQIVQTFSTSIEIKNLLEKEKEETEFRMMKAMRGFITAWHLKKGKEVVFDKSRGWSYNSLLLNKLFPEAKQIVLVRDLRNVFASIEKQHRKNALLDDASNVIEKTVFDRANRMFSPKGIIGNSIIGIEDLIRRNPKGVIFVQYETLVAEPEKTLKAIYEQLKEEHFEHDFKNIENTSIDPDGHYLHKYPHDGKGEVKSTDIFEWKKYISEDIANLIFNKFKLYNDFFEYNKDKNKTFKGDSI